MPHWVRDAHWFKTILYVPMYFFLGLTVAFWRKKWWHAAIICSIIALADETLKIFLPTREFAALYLVFDAVGFLIGIVIVASIRMEK